MKRSLSVIFFSCLWLFGLLAQERPYLMDPGQDANYIISYSPKVALPAQASLENVENRSIASVTYYDGLGRKCCEVAARGGGKNTDIAVLSQFDIYGRENVSWVATPIDASGGTHCPSPLEMLRIHSSQTEKANLQSEYEIGSDGRLISQSRAGSPSSDRIRTFYGYCTSYDESAFKWNACLKLTSVSGSALTKPATQYKAGELKTVLTVDEDGDSICRFYDWQGRCRCHRVLLGNGQSLDTYYVYDRNTDLVFVIQPEGVRLIAASNQLTGTLLKNYAFCYSYDHLHRCISAKVPGCDAVYFVYDKYGQPVMRQDGVQRQNNVWTIRQYDHLLRPAVEGLCTFSGKTHLQLRQMMNDSTFTAVRRPDGESDESLYYISDTKATGFTPYMAWFYDDYKFVRGKGVPYLSGYPVDPNLPATSLPTGTACRVKNITYVTANYYDKEGRVVCSIEYDHYGNQYRLTELSAYNFDGTVNRSLSRFENITEHTYVNSSKQVEFTHTYDELGRLESTSYRTGSNSSFEFLRGLRYNSIGNIATCVDIDSTVYTYDVAGRLTSFSSPSLSQSIFYNSAPKGVSGVRVRKNGFITAITDREDPSSLLNCRNICYTYDKAGRLTAARDERIAEIYEYDKNTNITALKRHVGGKLLSDLTFGFEGNRMTSIAEHGSAEGLQYFPMFPGKNGSRTYDASGRLISDDIRDISSITYSPYGNYTEAIHFENGDRIIFEYRPDGVNRSTVTTQKVIKSTLSATEENETFATGSTTLYDTRRYYGAFEQHGTSWLYHTPTGHIDLATGIHYYYTLDFQGSTRAVYTERALIFNQSSDTPVFDGITPGLTFSKRDVLQRMNYFPSGLPVNLSTSVKTLTDRLHLGKPWINLDGVALYNNSARLHDPVTGTFTTPDPLAHDYTGFSPYALCMGNPIKFIDLDGEKPSPYEMALMCVLVYKEHNKDFYKACKAALESTDWKISNVGHELNLKLNHSAKEDIGMQSMVFERTKNDVTEYAYVFAGTNCWEDGVEDLTQLVGVTTQISQALENARALVNFVGIENLTFGGHSLGGKLAAASSMATGCEAMTFNPAALSPFTMKRFGLKDSGKIINYISSTPEIYGTNKYVDPLTVLQVGLGFGADGSYIPVITGFRPTHSIDEIVKALAPIKSE